MPCFLQLGPAAEPGDAALPADPKPAGPQESELLREQLEYLIAHSHTCQQGCPACRRFRIVRNALMRVWQ